MYRKGWKLLVNQPFTFYMLWFGERNEGFLLIHHLLFPTLHSITYLEFSHGTGTFHMNSRKGLCYLGFPEGMTICRFPCFLGIPRKCSAICRKCGANTHTHIYIYILTVIMCCPYTRVIRARQVQEFLNVQYRGQKQSAKVCDGIVMVFLISMYNCCTCTICSKDQYDLWKYWMFESLSRPI